MDKEREDYLWKVTLGSPAILHAKIQLCDYDENWPALFMIEKNRILSVLEHVVIEHVGSTSVPGLCAKPIIDILLLVDDSSDEDTYVPNLQQAHYYLKVREPQWYEHRMFHHPDTKVNLHVFSKGCEEAERMLRFRDILRKNEDALHMYADKKRELAEKTWNYMQEYADAKSEVVSNILKKYVS